MPIAPSSLVHVVYRTRRFEEMLAWYAKVFGARIQHRNPALAFLTFDHEHHRFAFADLGVIRPDEDDRDDRGDSGASLLNTLNFSNRTMGRYRLISAFSKLAP